MVLVTLIGVNLQVMHSNSYPPYVSCLIYIHVYNLDRRKFTGMHGHSYPPPAPRLFPMFLPSVTHHYLSLPTTMSFPTPPLPYAPSHPSPCPLVLLSFAARKQCHASTTDHPLPYIYRPSHPSPCPLAWAHSHSQQGSNAMLQPQTTPFQEQVLQQVIYNPEVITITVKSHPCTSITAGATQPTDKGVVVVEGYPWYMGTVTCVLTQPGSTDVSQLQGSDVTITVDTRGTTTGAQVSDRVSERWLDDQHVSLADASNQLIHPPSSLITSFSSPPPIHPLHPITA